MHDIEWATTQKDVQGRVIEQTCGCGCGLYSWFSPDDKDADRRYGPKPVIVLLVDLATASKDSWTGKTYPPEPRKVP